MTTQRMTRCMLCYLLYDASEHKVCPSCERKERLTMTLNHKSFLDDGGEPQACNGTCEHDGCDQPSVAFTTGHYMVGWCAAGHVCVIDPAHKVYGLVYQF